MPSYAVITQLPADVEMAAPAAAVGSVATTALPVSGLFLVSIGLNGSNQMIFTLSDGSTLTSVSLNTLLASYTPLTRQIIAGTGLTGGGTLAADRTLAASYGTASGTAAQGNDSRITGAVQKVNLPSIMDAATYHGNDSAQNTLFASLAAGGAVYIPDGVTIGRGSNFAPTQEIHILGPGTFKDTRAVPTTEFITIGPAASGSTIKCKLLGSVGGTYVSPHHAIVVQGTDNGAGNAPTFVTGITIDSPEVSGFGSMAVFGEFAQIITDIGDLHDIGYAGVIIHSALYCSTRLRRVHDLTPGTSGNSYGINYDRRDSTSDLVRYPHSKHSYAYIDVMYNCPLWDGVGCHGGDDLYLGYGVMYGVKHPIDIVPSAGAGGTALFAPNNIRAEGGVADSGVFDGSRGPAVVIAGAYNSAVVEYAKGIKVTIGVLRGYGVESDSTSGAVVVHSTQGMVLDLGTVREASPWAANFGHDNQGFTLLAITASDPWANSVATAGVVAVSGLNNTGWIVAASGANGSKAVSTAWAATTAYTYNQFVLKSGYIYRVQVPGTSGSTGPVGTVRGGVETDGTITWVNVNTAATHVNNRGLSVTNDVSNVIRLASAADFSSASTPVVGPVVGATLPSLGPNGSAAAPAYSFAGDPDTGVFWRTTNDLGFSAGGTEVFHIVSTAMLLDDGKNISTGSTTGTIFPTGSTQKLGFWGRTPVVQPSRIGQLTDSSTGSATSTIADVGAAFSQSGLNNIHASLAAKINALEVLLHNVGLEA